MTLLSQLEFGSLLAYTPRPKSDEQKKTKDFMYSLKNDKLTGSPPCPTTVNIARYILSNFSSLPFGNYFGSHVTLIPVPSSSLKNPGDLWVSSNLARALEDQKLGNVIECIKRKFAVPKAATSKSNERPTPGQYYQSVEIQLVQSEIKSIVLVDDVITRGATAIGVASKLREIYPNVPIKLFVALRTISNPDEFKSLTDSCVGTIKIDQRGVPHRTP